MKRKLLEDFGQNLIARSARFNAALMHIMKPFGVVAIFTVVGLALCTQRVAAQTSPTIVVTRPQVIHESKHDATQMPVREMPPVVRAPTQAPPLHHFIKKAPEVYQPDLAVQTAPGPSVAASQGLNFEGLGAGLPLASVADPPDTNLSVGDNQVVETINFEFAVFNKSTGNLLYGPAVIWSLWSGFGGACENLPRGDPVVVFDKAAHRWIIAELAGSGPDTECVAVSQTSDATGSYYRYVFNLGQADYVKLGVWPDAYYLSNNAANTAGTRYPELCALDRSHMLTGASATAQCFFPNGSYGLMLPSDLDGSMPPPARTPNYFLGLDGQLALNLFKFHVDFSNPSNSTFTGPTQIPIQSYNSLSATNTIPQPGVSDLLETLGWVMYRLAYRNFGNHESLVVNHTVDAGGGIAGIRWYEIRNPGAVTPTVYQQGTFSPDSNDRWMGSIAMDHAGDIALGYSISSSSMYPSINYTGRVPSDPLGTLEAETTLISGTGSDTLFDPLWGGPRWGDYTSMSIDPIDDCTFWYANEYFTQTGQWPANTRIGSFKFPTCTTRVTTSLSPGTATVVTGTLNSGTVSNLKTKDGKFYVVASTTAGGTKTAAWYGSFTGVSPGLTALNISYAGKNSLTCGQQISIWNWITKAWVQVNLRNVGTTEVLIRNLVPSGKLFNYVNSTTGMVRVKVTTTNASNAFTSSADLLQLTVTQ